MVRNLCAAVFSVCLASGLALGVQQEVDRFLQVVKSTLAPVYGPLAEQVVSDYGLQEKRGVGIDLGSGPGHLIIELCKRTEQMHWVNADINPGFFPVFMEMAEQQGVKDRVSAMYADAVDLPFHDDYADVLVSRGSFQFWSDKEKALSEIFRVLKPGGVALIGRGFSENLPPSIARKIREQQSKGGGMPEYDVDQVAAEFKRIAESLGIEDFRIRIPEPPGADGIRYGIWLEFRKARQRQTRPPRLLNQPELESTGLDLTQTTVTQEDIEKQGAKNVVEALTFVPGSWIESRGRKVKQFFSVRGQRYPYPEYSLDGVLFREFHELPYFFSTGDLERIEILRSGAAMLTGTSGLSGIVNLVPRQYRQQETSLTAEFGSLETYRLHLSHGGKTGDVSYGLGVDGYGTGGPEGREGAEQLANLFGHLSWQVSPKLSVSGNLFHIQGERELVQAVAPAGNRLRTALERFDPIQSTFATVKALYQPSDIASTQLVLGYSNRRNDFVAASANAPGSHETSHDWDSEWSLNGVQAVALSESNVVRVGVNYNHWVAPYGKRFYSGRRADLETFAVTAVDEHRWGRLLLDGGIRYQRTYINEYGAFNINGSAQGLANVTPVLNQWEPPTVSGSLGGKFSLTKNLSLHGNLLRGSLEPRRGTLNTEMVEPLSEKKWMGDFGFGLSQERLGELIVSGFLIHQEDALVLSGRTATVDSRIMELWDNRDQTSKGLEMDFRSRPFFEGFRAFFNLMALQARAKQEGVMRNDVELPKAILGAGLLGTKGKYDFNLFWKYVSSYQSSRFASPPVLHPLGDFHNLNLTLGRTLGSTDSLRAYLEVSNLSDSEFMTVVGYPDYGRRILIGIRQRF